MPILGMSAVPGNTASDPTYLDLTAGPYSLGLQARAVVAVQQDVPLQREAVLRGASVPMCDLSHLLGGTPRAMLPFVMFVEAGGRTAAIGVDRVGHLRHPEAPKTSRVPAFGLRRAQLIEGALRVGDRLLIVLHPGALVDLVYEESRRI